MQVWPENFLIAWQTLSNLPSQATEKTFKLALKYRSGEKRGLLSQSDIVKFLSRSNVDVSRDEVHNILCLMKLLASDVVVLQLSDEAQFSRRLGKVVSKFRDGSAPDDSDLLCIKTLASCLTPEAVSKADGAQTIKGTLICTSSLKVKLVGSFAEVTGCIVDRTSVARNSDIATESRFLILASNVESLMC